MGIHDRDYYRGEPANYGIGSAYSGVAILIAANVICFVLGLVLVERPGSESFRRRLQEAKTREEQIVVERSGGEWFKQGMEVSGRSITQPTLFWQIFTYGFAHADVLHIFLNMFALWIFGRDIEAHYGKREFLWYYCSAILIGGLWFAGKQAFFERHGFALGASGACSAVLLLFILNFPKRTVLFFVPMPAWVLGVVVVLLDFLGVGRENVAFDIHLSGFAFAAVYYWTGFRFTRWGFSGQWMRRVKRRVSGAPSLKVHVAVDEGLDEDLEREGDRVLAKLNASGDASLTPKERKILEEYSRRTREKLRRRTGRD